MAHSSPVHGLMKVSSALSRHRPPNILPHEYVTISGKKSAPFEWQFSFPENLDFAACWCIKIAEAGKHLGMT
jgi:hypothetical protein